jgi:hypothetical protein
MRTAWQVTRSGAVTFAQAGAILASLGLSVHRMSPPPEAFHLRGWMDTAFRLSGDIVPKHIASGILALIDWTFTIRAPAALDHGFTHISLTEFALDVTDNPPRPLAVNAAAQSEYARLSGKPVAALRQAMETWLPIAIVRYFLLMGGADKRAMAADDAARRSGPAPAGLNPSSRAWPSMRLLSVGFGSRTTKLKVSITRPLSGASRPKRSLAGHVEPTCRR